MWYYKVIKHGAGFPAGLKTNTKLIDGELYTEKECTRLGMMQHTLNNYTIRVFIPKNNTEFIFGARFSKQ